ncbi:DNA-binding protein [Streptomyces sp. x-19]|uniref:DNA-binding protein n=1 Tax=Streptomyces sp. x-19 TaxID=2789280 RepID=UPI00397FED3A
MVDEQGRQQGGFTAGHVDGPGDLLAAGQVQNIAFVKVGRHVRIAENVLVAYIEANTVQPACRTRSHYGKAA